MLPFLCGNFVQRASGGSGDRQNKAGGTGGAACFGKRQHCGGTGADLGGKREAERDDRSGTGHWNACGGGAGAVPGGAGGSGKRPGDGGAAGEAGASGERARGSRAIADMGAGWNDRAADRRRTGRAGERRAGKEGRVEQRRGAYR